MSGILSTTKKHAKNKEDTTHYEEINQLCQNNPEQKLELANKCTIKFLKESIKFAYLVHYSVPKLMFDLRFLC